MLPKISIIIPAYNAEKTLRSCVNAAFHQDYEGDLEVVIVDDGSIDATADLAKTFDRAIYIFQENAGPAAARNAGAGQASGEIICFTDADCRPQPDWVKILCRSFSAYDAGVVAGAYGIANPESLLACCIHREICYRHEHLMGDWIEVFGSYNVAFRRDVFERIGGFNESYRHASGEDNDLSYRLSDAGIRIRFAKEAKVDHRHPSQVGRYLQEQFRHGFWRAWLYRQHPKRIRGDGYTFFKDIIELPLSLGFILVGILIFFGVPWIVFAVGLMMFFIFECIFARVFGLKNFFQITFYSSVMLTRAFARAAGFIMGLISRPL